MPIMEELLHVEANVPILLFVKKRGGAYPKELEHALRAHPYTVRKGVEDLKRLNMLREVRYEGKVPHVKSWLVLTPLGDACAHCLLECEKRLWSIAERSNGNRRGGRP